MAGEAPDARELGRRSRAAVEAKDREGWLALFTDDAVVADPVGPSPFDPEGKGHRGREAITAFYDTVVAPSQHVAFEVHGSYLCGDEVADVLTIRTTLAGGQHVAVVQNVSIYRTDGKGRLVSLRAFWQFDDLELVEA
jgi:ketosteroid isomerase-like protein